MIITKNTANMDQFLIADANRYGLKAGETLASSQQASAKKLDPEILNKHMGETHKFFEGKDTKFTSLTEEEDKKSVTTSARKEKRSETEINQEVPACTIEETIEAPEEHLLNQKKSPGETELKDPPEPPVTADTIPSEAVSFIQWHQNSFSSVQEATDEYVDIANMTDTWSGIDILQKLASIDDPEQRAAAKKDLSDIHRRLSPENIDIPLGRGRIIKDVFMAVCEAEDNKEKQLIKDMAIAHIKASSGPGKGLENFKFVQSHKNPGQSLKEASDDFLEIANLSGDEFHREIRNIFGQIGSINDPKERVLAKNDAMDIFKRLLIV